MDTNIPVEKLTRLKFYVSIRSQSRARISIEWSVKLLAVCLICSAIALPNPLTIGYGAW